MSWSHNRATETGRNVIVRNDFQHPYSQQIIPIGGILSKTLNFGGSLAVKKSVKPAVPDILSIDLSIVNMKQIQEISTRKYDSQTESLNGTTPSANAGEIRSDSSNQSRGFESNKSKQSTNKTNLGADPNEEGSKIACEGDSFLAQIPDLSFMLQSSLSLPTS